MFRIHSIMNESRDKVKVYDVREDSNKNYYTILTGDNASGKSSLLSKAINFFLFSNKKDSFHPPSVERDLLSVDEPSKIIALCNSRFDKFTSTNIFSKNFDLKKSTYPLMSYIHPEINDNARRGVNGLVDQSIKNLLRFRNTRNLQDIYRVHDAFVMFGLQPDLHLKCSLNTQNLKYAIDILSDIDNGNMYLSDKGIENLKKYKYSKPEGIKNRSSILDSYIEIILKKNMDNSEPLLILDTLLMLDAGKLTSDSFNDIYFSVAEGSIYSAKKDLLLDFSGIETIKTLFILDVISVSDVQVMHFNSQKEVSIISLSSGQRTLLGHAIVLSSFAEKNCMICIDEPENSLHPEWQLNFMRFISLLCPESLEAHILIATHSPQIISGMQFDNGCVLSLVNRDNIDAISLKKDSIFGEGRFYELQALKIYREQSSDKQLTGVFKSPGYKNDFIIRKLLLILSKISKQISLKKTDHIFLNEIRILIEKNRIPKGDPVQLLISQIVSFERTRKSDD